MHIAILHGFSGFLKLPNKYGKEGNSDKSAFKVIQLVWL